jgi:hypothetical protein
MKYRIVDNGKRCFVPPCYSWDVFDEQDILVETVAYILGAGGEGLTDPPQGVYRDAEIDFVPVPDGPNAGTMARRLKITQ